ncbi:amine oxidase [Haematobacter massiliensis]|uniref:Tryptophan 2-monooxygenase n=1 Tax=Haematobacter massiliensis TaxID=195105 RepID=A0A086Y323_9RHOB|nr:NAD(P)/FAD-dependent oxidoreductase [Haematobacter massiliensis]KFI28673.1 amine oxidase [Haematobacter massiliensis]OWJ73522.1 amine oxidase [Haematobacter massiliensis]OWJ88604.1 amine oxidase [Haematobacter massiliensis]QBJ26218.1 FAD-dependent oxidoreductase [Haematobacter massiliensis]
MTLLDTDNIPGVSAFGPDFPFAYDDWLDHPAGLGSIPEERYGTRVAVIGAGAAGIVAAYELMKLGLRPIVYEAARFGGRLRSEPFEGTDGIVAELGGMRFPVSSRGFYHYIDLLGLESRPFPNPLTPAAGSTVIDLEGETHYARTLADLPPLYHQVAAAYRDALEEHVRFSDLQTAMRDRDASRLKELWDPLVRDWDERTFYDFVASSSAFSRLGFRHREVFGQVGFGTGGWDSDFPNSMLEILRVNLAELDDNQRFIVGGVEQMPQQLWRHPPERLAHWPRGTTLASLNGGVARGRVVAISRAPEGDLRLRDRWGREDDYPAVIVTCQSHLLTTSISVDETIFDQKLWMALDRTRYMQAAKTFVMVDRPFWRDIDPDTGREPLSMTLTDRITRGTYLFDNGPDQPAVICLSYSWMTDALKVLPLSCERRVELALSALKQIYPKTDIASHIVSQPICVSWEADENFLGAFKGALPGHYRYNHRMYGHFMQAGLPPAQRGIFLAGDGISWTPAWVEGAVQTALNAVWGVMTHLGGQSPADNPGPGDMYPRLGPLRLDD